MALSSAGAKKLEGAAEALVTMWQHFLRDATFAGRTRAYTAKQYLSGIAAIAFVALIHILAAYSLAAVSLESPSLQVSKYFHLSSAVYKLTFFGFLIFYPLYVALFVRPKRILIYLWRGYKWNLFSKERWLFSFPVLAIIPLEKSVYSSLKFEIPNIVPFRLDAVLHDLDKSLFGGVEPWRVLHPLIGDPLITRALDFLYHPFWLFLMTFVVLFHAVGRHSLVERTRFFVTYVVTWALLGNALALLMSSAGPCYFSGVVGTADPYRQLMAYLGSVGSDTPISAVMIQHRLWEEHVTGLFGNGGGISAMPSIHIATTLLFALSMRSVSRVIEKTLYLYTFVIWIGSIHLGWHYALDGVFSVPLVIALWLLVGKSLGVLFRRMRIDEPRPLEAPIG